MSAVEDLYRMCIGTCRKSYWEAYQKRSSLKKYREELCDYNFRPSFLTREDRTNIASDCSIEFIAKKFYTHLFRSTIPVRTPEISTGEKMYRDSTPEIRFAVESMKRDTDELHVLATHVTSCFLKKKTPGQ